ncbi:Reticulon-domain-containing protein [Apodospora peruviana]|uniref:Reticulon-like protein n=1 Tax=Apodospora peruviana TaxID=516989 RepID=A0AAE0M4P8_9PEZI|nr:Reticulon-domain-containing protein [Apodospora peruviana]
MADGAATSNGNLDALKNSKCLVLRDSHHRSPRRQATDDDLFTDAAAAYETVANGPVAQNVLDQHQKTTAELSNLAASRQTPANPAATGQPLTHYHSFFSELLSWNNPRASGIAYASLVSFIFAVRYLDLLRWGFKLTWMVLGITIAAEVAGKALVNNGFATQLRPRKYYTVPRETLDTMIGDVNELINFFVIEAQRIVFAENLPASIAAAVGAFISYYLVKIVPYWGLALLSATVLFFVPLIYTSNQELIDEQLKHATDIVSAQTQQLRTVASQQTEHATQLTKQYMGDYTSKAQSLIKGARSPPDHTPVKENDFPSAPKEEFKSAIPISEPATFNPDSAFKGEQEPLIVA